MKRVKWGAVPNMNGENQESSRNRPQKETRKRLKPAKQGNQYILIGYHYDSNVIWTEPIRNRQGPIIMKGWKKLRDMYEQWGRIRAHGFLILKHRETFSTQCRRINVNSS